MVRHKHPNATGRVKRFTVSLEVKDYDRLIKLARRHQPRLSLQYVVQYAIQSLLREAEKEPQFASRMRSPLKSGGSHGER